MFRKRVGDRLHKLKKRVHGLGGKGKLTEAIIDHLQNYYGIAIRSNNSNISGMKTAIYASLKVKKVGAVTKEMNQLIQIFINWELGCQKKSLKKLN